MKKYLVILLGAILITNAASAQLIGKKKSEPQEEDGGKLAFDKGVQETRMEARSKLKPYKYDGVKSTYYNYKTYTYVKEVEVLTVEATDYKFVFNGAMVTDEPVKIEIYNKPQNTPGRILLFEEDGVSGNEVIANLEDMNEVLRAEYGKVSNLDQKIIDKMRLKKIYVNYVIPAVDREFESVETATGKTKETTIIQYSAMVMAVGYQFL